MDPKTTIIYDENQFVYLLDELAERLPLRRRAIFLVGEERKAQIRFVHEPEDAVAICYPSSSSVVETTMLILYGYAIAFASEDCEQDPTRLSLCDAVERVADVLRPTNVAAADALMMYHHHVNLVGAAIRGGITIEGEEQIEQAVRRDERARTQKEETEAAMTRSRILWHMQGPHVMRNPKC